MSLFRRGKTSLQPEDADPTDPTDPTAEERAPGDADAGPDDPDRAGALEAEHAEDARREALETRRSQSGPFDASEVELDTAPVDLGALRLAAPQGMELRLEVEQENQRVVAVTLASGPSSVQVHVFAAPRRAGVWDEVRGEIAESVKGQGGAVQEIDNDTGFGRELLAQLPAKTPDGRDGFTVTRFAGVDGPRWFLRAVFSGAAALERAAAAPFEAAVRDLVVVRGDEAMAPRDLLSLRLPPGAAPGGQPGAAPDPAATTLSGPVVEGSP